MHVYPKRWCLSTKQHVVEIKDRYIHSHPHHRLKSVSSFTWPRQLCCCCKEHNGCVFYCMKHIDTAESVTWCFSDRASWIDYILITNLMHWSLFIHKILFSSTCFESQVLIFRMIQLYTCSIWYCHSVWEWQYHMLHVYNCILLKMSTWGSKHVEENSILWINNNQCINLVINV